MESVILYFITTSKHNLSESVYIKVHNFSYYIFELWKFQTRTTNLKKINPIKKKNNLSLTSHRCSKVKGLLKNLLNCLLDNLNKLPIGCWKFLRG